MPRLRHSLLVVVLVAACGEDGANPGSAGGGNDSGSGGKGTAGRGGKNAGGSSGAGTAGSAGAGRGANGGSGGTAHGGAPTGGRAGSTGGDSAGESSDGGVSGSGNGSGGTPASGNAGREQGGEAGNEVGGAGNEGGDAGTAGEENGGTGAIGGVAGSGGLGGAGVAGMGGFGGAAGSAGSGGASVTHTLSLGFEGTGAGVVYSSPDGIACDASCSGTFAAGTVRLAQSAQNGSTFGEWVGCDSVSDNACIVELDSDRSVSVTFDQCPQATISDTHYVDVFLGRDHPAHGGGEGRCAYKSITFALAYTSGDVRVAPGTYDAEESFPLTLEGTRRLICAEGESPSLIGMTPNSGTAMLFLLGTQNSVENCWLDMRTFPGTALGVDSGGEHTVTGVQFRGSATGATIFPSASRVDFTDCGFHGNSTGIRWYEGTRGHLQNNDFTANASASVRCSFDGGSEAITGSLNHLESCLNCAHCPFE